MDDNAKEITNYARDLALTKLSHEFRAPLASIIGFTTLLLKNKHDTLDKEELICLDRILQNSHHLMNLINGIIDIYKGKVTFEKEASYELIDLSEMIQLAVQVVEGQALEKGLKISTEIPEETKPFNTIPGKLKIILINLLSNAVKFTKAGTIVIRVKNDIQRQTVSLIEISDPGQGLPQEQLEKLLHPFSLDTPELWGDGYGLGLAITRSLCDQLHYRLTAESELGKGSTFQIYT